MVSSVFLFSGGFRHGIEPARASRFGSPHDSVITQVEELTHLLFIPANRQISTYTIPQYLSLEIDYFM